MFGRRKNRGRAALEPSTIPTILIIPTILTIPTILLYSLQLPSTRLMAHYGIGQVGVTLEVSHLSGREVVSLSHVEIWGGGYFAGGVGSIVILWPVTHYNLYASL